jgi:hypothetical protein
MPSRHTVSDTTVRARDLQYALDSARREVRSEWFKAIVVTAGGLGTFLASAFSLLGEPSGWTLVAWIVFLVLAVAAAQTWRTLHRSRTKREAAELEWRREDAQKLKSRA